jgi:hypothetical protein
MTVDELDGPVLDPFRTPGPKVDDQHRTTQKGRVRGEPQLGGKRQAVRARNSGNEDVAGGEDGGAAEGLLVETCEVGEYELVGVQH